MSVAPKIRDPKNLTEEEMLMLLNNDDPEFDDFLQEDSDEEIDHVSVDEDEDDEISGDSLDENDDEIDGTAKDIRTYVAKDGTEWSKNPKNIKVRRSLTNILNIAPGLTAYSSGISSIRDAFLLFITPEIINIIVTETNRKATDFYERWNAGNPLKPRTFVPTSNNEILAYVGLLLTIGALKSSKESVDMLWCTDPAYRRAIIPATMSRNRYQELTRFLRFDNFETREERRENDKLAAIREIFDIFVAKCKISCNPGAHICVDEQLVPYRGKAPFRVYMKSKPAKYGIKIWTVADCDSAYMINMQIYLGKV